MKQVNRLAGLLFLLCAVPTLMVARPSLIQYVNTHIGTGAFKGRWSPGNEAKGQCMPAVLVPNGMNAWTPQTEATERHGVCPFYAPHDNGGDAKGGSQQQGEVVGQLQGFRCSHWMNGSNTQDFGSLTIMPMIDSVPSSPARRTSAFTMAGMTHRPDYLAMDLYGGTIKVELTATARTGIFRLTFNKSGRAYILVTPNSDYNDAAIEGYGQMSLGKQRYSEVSVSNQVHRLYQGRGQRAGFAAHYLVLVNKTEGVSHVRKTEGNRQLYYMSFTVKAGEQVLVKVGNSYCDLRGAQRNIEQECPHWNFDQVHRDLTRIWEKRLAAITVSGATDRDKVKFYTSLYHASFLPSMFNDVDGRYPSFGGGKHIMHTDGVYYDGYSLWDTFRALHPLLSILYPQQSGHMMQSLVDKYRQGGWLPIFPAWNSYTSEMIGDPCASLFADAYIKGIRNFDVQTAYEALLKNAYQQPASFADYKDGKGRRALVSYMKYGYIPLEDPVREAFHQREQVSRTLEYAYADYCVARLAEALGHQAVADSLYARSKNYRNVFDPRIGYVMGRHADGSFITGKRPDQGQSFITEGNPCQYSWFVPHDVYGLFDCMGGRHEYLLRLDSMFTAHRMWHGNEPSHHIAYLYNYVGKPWLSAQRVRHLMDTEYGLGPDGLSGNDDAGQMAAWYVFSALGFYPVCPGSGYYVLASPSFGSAILHMASGKRFTIVAHGASDQNIYIQSARLNGRPYDLNYLSHADIAAGGTLVFEMGSRPNEHWGSAQASCPPAR